MVKVVGVRFRTAGKIYFFDPGKLSIKRGDFILKSPLLFLYKLVTFI